MKKETATITNLSGKKVPAKSFMIRTKAESKKYGYPIGTWMMQVKTKDIK
jgi:hypothetical protein